MLKQPVSVVNYTNVAIVRLKLGKKRFEIACYKNKVQQYRQKVENDINEVLQIDKIYSNVIKGDMAKKEDLEATFPNMSYAEIFKLILDKGEIQVSEKERNLNFQNTKNNIASIIVEKTYNKDNGMPFPQNVILQVLDDINYQIKDTEDAKKQALKAIKLISEKHILPIERKMMQVFISFKNPKGVNDFEDFKTKFQDFLKKTNTQILESNLESAKHFMTKCNISPNHYREFLTNYEEILSIEIISNSQVVPNIQPVNKPQIKITKEEVAVDTFSNMKISNTYIDNLLNDESVNKKKKILTCTKCKGSAFNEQDELRKHFKSNWHNFNAKLSAQGKESLTVDEFDEFVLMHPEAIK